MPNWGGANQKALDAKAKKAVLAEAKKQEELAKREAAAWHDPITDEKLSKKEADARRRQQEIDRKQQLRKLAQEEEEKLSAASKSKKPGGGAKLTRAEIQARLLKSRLEAIKLDDKKETDLWDIENPNKVVSDVPIVTSVDEFIAAEEEEGDDRFWTKRLKAAYNTYYEANLPVYREEFPGLKKSQIDEKIFKAWQKAPENPKNKQRRDVF